MYILPHIASVYTLTKKPSQKDLTNAAAITQLTLGLFIIIINM